MNEKDYPALFEAADTASNRTQSHHLRTVLGYLSSLVVGSTLAFYGIEHSYLAIIGAFIFIVGLFLTYILLNKNFENTWYNCRALAESIKTSTWRYMMRAEPYEDCENVQIANTEFRNLLTGLLKQSMNISHELGGEPSEREQITQKMKNVRAMSLNERKRFYLDHRIDEQRKWYSKKYIYNKKQKKKWFTILIVFNVLALIFVSFRIYYPSFGHWPSEIFVVLSGACLTWIQVKKFQELTSAYSLTAHEIGTIRGEIEKVESEEKFSDFVNNSENAFSREHTQWLAKRIY
ncbi:MAG: DUF4231 domain-containing protein [Balneolaceae bacterium]